jgi:hypothetical protein
MVAFGTYCIGSSTFRQRVSLGLVLIDIDLVQADNGRFAHFWVKIVQFIRLLRSRPADSSNQGASNELMSNCCRIVRSDVAGLLSIDPIYSSLRALCTIDGCPNWLMSPEK